MLISYEMNLHDFDTWSGANSTKDELTCDELDIIESCLIDLYPHGISETELNDFLWFDRDIIAEWLGFNSWYDLVDSHE